MRYPTRTPIMLEADQLKASVRRLNECHDCMMGVEVTNPRASVRRVLELAAKLNRSVLYGDRDASYIAGQLDVELRDFLVLSHEEQMQQLHEVDR